MEIVVDAHARKPVSSIARTLSESRRTRAPLVCDARERVSHFALRGLLKLSASVHDSLTAQRARPNAEPPLEWGAPLGQLIDSSEPAPRVRVVSSFPSSHTTMPAYIVAFKTGDDVQASAVDDACAKVESSGGQ